MTKAVTFIEYIPIYTLPGPLKIQLVPLCRAEFPAVFLTTKKKKNQSWIFKLLLPHHHNGVCYLLFLFLTTPEEKLPAFPQQYLYRWSTFSSLSSITPSPASSCHAHLYWLVIWICCQAYTNSPCVTDNTWKKDRIPLSNLVWSYANKRTHCPC